MSQSSRHIPNEQLADYAEHLLSAALRADVDRHLADCEPCAARAAGFTALVDLMQTDDTQDAPAHVIARAIRAFRTEHLGSTSRPAHGLRRRLEATLRFDSAQRAFALGQRAGRTSERELLYDAGENTLEVRVDHSEAGWTVGGQVLGPYTGGEVEIEGATDSASTGLNELCEFTLPPVEEGVYLLILRLDDIEVEVPGLDLRA